MINETAKARTPSKIPSFLSSVAATAPPPERKGAPVGWERVYFRALYWMGRKFLKKAQPLHYARHIAGLLIQTAKGPYQEDYDNNLLAPCDAITLTLSFQEMLSQLEAEVILRNLSAFGGIQHFTVRDFCINNDDGRKRYADAGEHIAAHAMTIHSLTQLLAQPESFFVGDNDLINRRLLQNGLNSLVIYMESVLSIRL